MGEQTYYYQRKKIYDYINIAIAKGLSEDEAVSELEDRRLSNNWTLNMLQRRMRLVK